jgi:hypothetical protein
MRRGSATPFERWSALRGPTAEHLAEAMTDRPHIDLTEQQRENAEQVLLRLFRSRYPGHGISVEWDKPNTISDVQPTPRHNNDRGQDAA